MDELIQEFRARVMLPRDVAPVRHPFIVGVIGQIGSGKTTVAWLLFRHLQGSVVVSADSARFLLREKGMSWGDNVRTLVLGVAESLLQHGYGVILDGLTSELKNRRKISELANRQHAVAYYVRLKVPPEVCRRRVRDKYDDPSWISSFINFRVNTTQKMLENLKELQALHDNLMDNDIGGLVGIVTNVGSLVELEQQVEQVTLADLRVLRGDRADA